MRHAYGVLSTILIAGLAATAEDGNVTFTPNKVVHKAESPGKVHFLLKNGNSHPIEVEKVARIFRQEDVETYEEDGAEMPEIKIYAQGSGSVSGNTMKVEAGKSLVYSWDKKWPKGSFVIPGSYEVYTYVEDGNDFSGISCTFALTPTGSFSGNPVFPLAKGNTWTYGSPAKSASVKVVSGEQSGWYTIQGLLDGNRLARVVGSGRPVLQVASGSITNVLVLFRLNRPVGTSWKVTLPPDLGAATLKVVSLKDKVETPVGTFTNCTRIDVVGGTSSYKSFWFAKGIGLVRFTRPKQGGGVNVYRLNRAELMGTDGNGYHIDSDSWDANDPD